MISGFRYEVDDNCVVTQLVVAIPYRQFGTTFRAHLQGTLKKGQIGWPETSVRNYNYLLSNNPEERSSEIDHFAAHPYIMISMIRYYWILTFRLWIHTVCSRFNSQISVLCSVVTWNQRFPKAIAFSETAIKLSSSGASRHCSNLMNFLIVHRFGYWLWLLVVVVPWGSKKA